VSIELQPMDTATYRPHALHDGSRTWTETNCYADFWIEVLHAFGFDPVAALAFTLSSDFEGDQWTMFKPPAEDLRLLYGLRMNELNVWRPLDLHVAEHLGLGHMLTIDVDAWFLPDTIGTTYHAEHQKTTVAVQRMDAARRRLGYFHNAGYHELEGDDYDGALSLGAYVRLEVLPPYVEVVRFDRCRELEASALARVAVDLTRMHLALAPLTNPLSRMRKQVLADIPWLGTMDLATFHRYAFGSFRQCGANAGLSAAFAAWLNERDGGGLEQVVEHFETIAMGCKALEFAVARVVRGRTTDIEGPFGHMEDAWESAMSLLNRRYAG
jgi:Domain of unknown function (DUF1839)